MPALRIPRGEGAILNFLTLNVSVTTVGATGVSGSVATLNGNVNPNGSTGYTYFHWSTDPQLATMHTTGSHIVIANSAAQTFNASLTGLAASTKYYFQTVFHNSANGSLHFGSILSFTTSTGDATASPPAH